MTCDNHVGVVDYRVHTEGVSRENVQGGKENNEVGEEPQLE